MPNLRPCKTVCFYEATWGCDYPNTAGNGHLHFDGGNMNRFDVWNGTNWVAASFEPGSVIKVKRAAPWQDVYYEIGANGTSFQVVTTEHVLNVCGRNAQEVSMSQHKVVLQRCVPEPEDCDKTCDCLSGAQEPEAISINDFIDVIAPRLLKDTCLEPPIELDGCGSNKQLVMQEVEPGCWRLGVLSAYAKQIYKATAGNGDLAVPINNSYIWPTDFPAGYSLQGLRLDDSNGLSVQGGSGTIDESLIANNLVSSKRFNLRCRTSFEITHRFLVKLDDDINNSFAERIHFMSRWRVDGGSWVYPRSNLDYNQELSPTYPYNGVSSIIEYSNRNIFPAGNIDYQVLAMKPTDASEAVEIRIAAFPDSAGRYNGPVAFLTPITE